MLIVDDEPDILDGLRTVFERLLPGVRIETAASGPAALVKLDERPVDLVVSDYRMPGMDGAALLQRVQELAPQARRMLITAYYGPEVAEAASRAGVSCIVRKPFDMDELLRLVREHLEP